MVIQLRSLSVPTCVFAAVLCALTVESDCYAQHHAGHSHGSGFGGVQHGVGGFQGTGSGMYGGTANGQQFGGGGYNNYTPYNYGGFNSSAGFTSRYPIGNRSLGGNFSSPTFSSGTFSTPFFGVARGGYGALNYSTGYVTPVIWSTPYASYSPSVFGYGTGVFSPNFPSGTYISNGFVGTFPGAGYGSYSQSGWPYMTGLSPYSSGAIIAPSVLNLNLNMQPVFPSTASYSFVDPRLIDQLAPAPQPGSILVQPAAAFQRPDLAPLPADEPPFPAPQDGAPVLNEFDAVPRDQKDSSLADKIQSLRYQSSGDDAFQKSDYPTADVFYATAIRTAPDRRAPYLRMAIVRIAIGDFPQSAAYLKTALAMESDASRPWVTAEELYGQKVAERARSHGGPLWNWLAERPLSADRLLLAGMFQKLRGFNSTADQMLELASHEGVEAMLVSQLEQLVKNDIGPRAISDDLNQMIEQASRRNAATGRSSIQSAEKQSVEQSGGIFLRGDEIGGPPRETEKTPSPGIVPPEPPSVAPAIESATPPVPFRIPVLE